MLNPCIANIRGAGVLSTGAVSRDTLKVGFGSEEFEEGLSGEAVGETVTIDDIRKHADEGEPASDIVTIEILESTDFP